MNELQLEIYLRDEKDKQKPKLPAELPNYVCALANSGGQLVLHLTGKTWNENQVHGVRRSIEQKIENLIQSIDLATKVKCLAAGNGSLVFDFKKIGTLYTLHFHLHMPSDTQIMTIESTTSFEKVKQILALSPMTREMPTAMGCHQKEFIHNGKVKLSESRTIQLKNMKSERTQHVSVHQRITSPANKLANTASAFANLNGGNIYYGIQDDKTIVGEEVDDNEKAKIIRSVGNTMESMIWPTESTKPKKGQHWAIFFEPVKDNDDRCIPFRFVIVVFVAQCPGGVFAKEPESYFISDGKVAIMSFKEWKANLLSKAATTSEKDRKKDGEASNVMEKSYTMQWSSTEIEREYQRLNENLDRLRENGKWEEFWKEIGSLRTRGNTDIQLIIIFQSMCAAYMRKELQKAKDYRRKFKNLIERSENSNVFRVERLFMKASMRRSEERYPESHGCLVKAVELLETLPHGITTAWVHCMYAIVCTILVNNSASENKDQRMHQQKAKEHYRKSLEHAEKLEGIPKAKRDLKDTILIHKAFLDLGSSITGKDQRPTPPLSTKDISDLEDQLDKQMELSPGEEPRSQFNIIQYELVKCDIYYRLFQSNHQGASHCKDKAICCGKKAKELAVKNSFEELFRYSCYRLANLV